MTFLGRLNSETSTEKIGRGRLDIAHPYVRHLLGIDLEAGEEFEARAAIERLAAWSEPVRHELGIDFVFPERNGSQRQRAMIEAGASREEVFAASVAETARTYPQEVPV